MAKRVLLVDDDPHIQELVKFYLKNSELELSICKDGYLAIEALHANKYDLLVLDIAMPHMNGFQTLKNIRQSLETAAIPVIMLTGSKDKMDIVKALRLGITDFILKPPVREDFVARVEKILGAPEDKNSVVVLAENNESSQIEVSIVLQLKSVSEKSLVLTSPIALPKGFELNLSELQLFRQLELETLYYRIGDCLSSNESKFDYEVKLLNLTPLDNQKIKLWLKTKTYPV